MNIVSMATAGTAYLFWCWLYRWLSVGVKTLRIKTSDNLEDLGDDLFFILV